MLGKVGGPAKNKEVGIACRGCLMSYGSWTDDEKDWNF